MQKNLSASDKQQRCKSQHHHRETAGDSLPKKSHKGSTEEGIYHKEVRLSTSVVPLWAKRNGNGAEDAEGHQMAEADLAWRDPLEDLTVPELQRQLNEKTGTHRKLRNPEKLINNLKQWAEGLKDFPAIQEDDLPQVDALEETLAGFQELMEPPENPDEVLMFEWDEGLGEEQEDFIFTTDGEEL